MAPLARCDSVISRGHNGAKQLSDKQSPCLLCGLQVQGTSVASAQHCGCATANGGSVEIERSENVYEREMGGETVFIVDEWCWGFIKGVRLDTTGWKPLKRERPDLMKPLELFGTSAGFRELDAGGADKMHALWSPRIGPAVRDIHAFWLPHRQRLLAQRLGSHH